MIKREYMNTILRNKITKTYCMVTLLFDMAPRTHPLSL